MRKSRTPNRPGYREPLAFPTLIALVAGLVLFGVMQYDLLLAVGSAIFVSFFGWLWWQHKFAAPAPRRHLSPRKRKR